MTYDEIKDAVDALLAQHSYEFHIRYVGETTRDNDWKCDAWRATITSPEKRHMESDYYTGLGLRKSKTPMPNLKKSPLSPRQWKEQNEKPVALRAADVLHSLLLDGEAINQSFDDWCGDFGYDTDS